MKLITLNMERSCHLDRILPFLQQEQPDLICLQEVMKSDLGSLQAASGLSHCAMSLMTQHPNEINRGPHGIAILSRYECSESQEFVYSGQGDGSLLFDRTSLETKLNTSRYLVLLVKTETPEGIFHVGTTHFPWTPDGQPRDFQFKSAEKIISQFSTEPIVFTGDLNSPRGGPVFSLFSEQWQDCIPKQEKTSIDPKLHRAGPLELMVDGLFLSHHYQAKEVKLISGVSDHKAIVATIQRLNLSHPSH